MAAGAIEQDARGQFTTGRGFTEKQRVFIEACSNGVKPMRAAEAAGFAHPSVDACRLMRIPAVVAAIRQGVAARVLAHGAAVSVDVLIEVATDKAQTGAARVSAARALGQMAGMLAKDGAAQAVDDDRPLEARSIGELEQMGDDLAAMLKAAKLRERVIDHASGGDAHGDARIQQGGGGGSSMAAGVLGDGSSPTAGDGVA